MKLNEYIEELKEILEEHGDLDLIYSRDSEGNGFENVFYSPSIMYKEGVSHRFDAYSEDDLEDDEKEDYQKVVCVN